MPATTPAPSPCPSAADPLAVLALADAYAAARSRYDDSFRELATWAAATDHAAMLDARAALAEALGIPAADVPALTSGGAL